ncbi:response regulator [Colwellia piezophila]|uniref:response regulator n=1 Tax=Colwellia piezophila TaxID=211668 RepID=UPI00038185FF|nr:response regulator [Colwellia piezophila]
MAVNVVYIDDDEDLCYLFKAYLNSDLINIEVFSEEDKAIQYCNQEQPDIIFIDYRLKSKTGLEVSNEIKINTLRILVTGEFGIDVGSSFNEIIEKPYKLADIREFILDTEK